MEGRISKGKCRGVVGVQEVFLVEGRRRRERAF